ncbi:DNA polymerase III subunit gamma/tau [Acetobacter estunensis]|uniref:DNA polymerase III subunit gamma/tau n=1 Tax=Acetobacter estunensis TaxID=104097 RepID=A0A967ECH0_9PROT|nr:DNA polymerase III subunit gamma/tau [Acetobacter estunensis]NHO54608.1 DNA polymerase III subunit gamma/tau [Acetobacter estunensis]
MSETDTSTNDDLPMPPSDGGGFLFGDQPEPAPEPVPVTTPTPEKTGYRVLARKYRPATLDELIGQDALVRTLRNAFATGRVAHAFMLTGVRGVGKTTTARILARGLNCTGPDGKGGPTADPCGVCPNCVAILADRHPDVLEMDAASRTGVDDVREIIEACHFRPIQGRMKVFIIDEVHMLSRNAFNALLKTLEEPPSQVTFVFATTELRKVPVTVLSRCQRFDLRRIAQSELVDFFGRVAAKEEVKIAPDALRLLARAADGSVRDGLSLLDQAIAQGDGSATISEESVAAMLGLSDRTAVFDLFGYVMKGDVPAVIALCDDTCNRGGDPGIMLRDLAELTHMVTRLKTVRSLQETMDLPEAERTRGVEFAQALSLSALSRLWQMLLKGIAEVDGAPLQREAAEMVLIRLCHAATLPAPEDLLKQFERGGGAGQGAGVASANAGHGTAPSARLSSPSRGEDGGQRRVANGGWTGEHEEPPPPVPLMQAEPAVRAEPPRSWRALVAFVKECREATLHGHLLHSTHLVTFAAPMVEIRVDRPAPADLPKRLQNLLRHHFGPAWTVRMVDAPGEPTLAEQSAEIIQLHRHRSAGHPLVQAIMEAFPGAQLGDVKDHTLDDHYGLPAEEPPVVGLDPEPFHPEDSMDEPDPLND